MVDCGDGDAPTRAFALGISKVSTVVLLILIALNIPRFLREMRQNSRMDDPSRQVGLSVAGVIKSYFPDTLSGLSMFVATVWLLSTGNVLVQKYDSSRATAPRDPNSIVIDVATSGFDEDISVVNAMRAFIDQIVSRDDVKAIWRCESMAGVTDLRLLAEKNAASGALRINASLSDVSVRKYDDAFGRGCFEYLMSVSLQFLLPGGGERTREWKPDVGTKSNRTGTMRTCDGPSGIAAALDDARAYLQPSLAEWVHQFRRGQERGAR